MNDRTVIARKRPLRSDDRAHYLVAIDGPQSGRTFRLEKANVVLGRLPGVDLQIEDPAISGQHCRLSVIASDVVVDDLGSSNGTFVDEKEIEGPTVLAVGSLIQVGDSLLKLEYRSPAEVEAEERLADDLDSAAAYVRSLLPVPISRQELRTEWRFIPSAQLGGDAFGYHWIDAKHFAFYLIDVCHHGTAPALHAVSVVNDLRKQTLPGADFTDPSTVLARLNESFQMHEHGDMYFTLWYGVYDVEARRLRFASAGHPPGLLVTPAGDGKELRTRNVAIGLFEEAQFENGETAVAAGSRLYVYSDGAYEILTTDGADWTLEGFLAIVGEPPQPGVAEPRRIERRVRELMQGEAFEDDFSLLVLHFA